MAHLSLSLLGSLQVTLDGQPITGFKSNKARGLLAYLAVEADRPHRRETLAGLLWPDWPDQDALSNLRYTLSNLRLTISDQRSDPSFLLITRDTLQFNPSSDHWLDVETFARLADVDRASPSAVEHLAEAVALYKGRFLEGFSLSESSAFEEWVLHARERLARQVSNALHFLADTCEQNRDYKGAQTQAGRLLELEPWDETAHQKMMRILALNGQRGAALAQYQACCRALADELDVEPSQETTRLYEQIRDGKLKSTFPSPLTSTGQPAILPAFLKEETSQGEPLFFVARERELRQLDGFLEQVLAGQGRVVFVTGEAGSGKTTLLQEFALRAEETHAGLTIASGNCNAYTGIGDPFLPFREILELLTGDVEAKVAAKAISGETARRLWQMLPTAVQALVERGPGLIDTFLSSASLRERARKYVPGGAGWLERLDELIERKSTGGFLPPGPLQSDMFEQYTRVLQALAGHGPLLLVLDDLQWADLGSISLLFHLGRHLAGNRILIVGTYRPEEVALEQDGKRHPLEAVVNEFRRSFGEIVVNVDQAEGREFIDAFLDSEPNRLRQPFREMLYRQTHGHPLFTVELLRGLQERGDLSLDADGCWVEGPALDWETLPARVEAAIRERIGRMPDTLRRALAVACVEGEQFTAEVVARVRGIDEREMLECLSDELDRRHRLVRAQSIRRLDGRLLSGYRFRHILFQKYLYSDLDEVERVHLHEQVGTTLEELHVTPEQAAAIAVQLALHFQKAGLIEKAIDYLYQAGGRAVRLSAYQEGIHHLTSGLQLLMNLPDSASRAEKELELQLVLGLACQGYKGAGSPEIKQAYIRARELCHRIGKTPQLCHVLEEIAISHYVAAEFFKAHELAEEALHLSKQTKDPLLEALGHWYVGFIAFGLGEFVTALNHLEKVSSFYKPQLHHQQFVALRGKDAGLSGLGYEACCLWCLGYPELAMQRSREALALAREFNHPFSTADVLNYGGCLFNQMFRDPQALKEYAEELEKISKEIVPGWGGAGIRYRGEAIYMLGQIEQGITEMQEGIQVTQAHGVRISNSGTLGALAEAQAKAGRPQEGMDAIGRALDFIEETGERYYEAELHRIKGELMRAQDREPEAEASFQTAIDVARRQQARMWELRAVASLSRLWQKHGKTAQAGKRLAEIYNWFTEGFDTPDLIEARKLLEEFPQN